jgi:RNA-directed DNA polymerase
MSVLKKLHDAQSIADVAGILGFKTKNLAYILYAQPDSLKYKEFVIPKKSGGVRSIAAPQGGLKLLQRRLADILQDCLSEIDNIVANDEKAKSCDQASHGFKRGFSIRTNAKKHRNRRYVFNVDLTDFFGSPLFLHRFLASDRGFLKAVLALQ